ncbi:MAG: hypothetical protein H6Q72_4040, partial [Firmicutes bacterium]|nr:hypothetical protein [Bacillota bacterium]
GQPSLTIGGIAQLGERLNGIQEVSGSIPLISTRKHKACEVFTSQAFLFV